jgi:hypothetical protein
MGRGRSLARHRPRSPVGRIELESELVSPESYSSRGLSANADHRWDLWWPPVWAGSYWTSSLQYRALVAGARLSRTIGRYGSTLGYDKVAPLVLDYLQESRPSPSVFKSYTETWLHADVLERKGRIHE